MYSSKKVVKKKKSEIEKLKMKNSFKFAILRVLYIYTKLCYIY